MARMGARMARAGVACGVFSMAAVAAGCMGYASYPNADGSLTRSTTNSRTATSVMREALRWVTAREDDGPGHFAINLPPGTSEEAYREIAATVGGTPLTAATMDLPRYSVGRVWVRAGEAKVDVTRPVMALGPMADGGWVTQTITVELEGGLAPWRVVRHRPWALGAIDEPAPNPLGVAAAPMNEPTGAPARPTAEADQPEPEAPEPEAPRADAEPDVIEIVP